MGLNLNSWNGMAFLNLEKPPQEPTSVGHCHYKSGVRWLILNSSHCTRNMYHVIHAQV